MFDVDESEEAEDKKHAINFGQDSVEKYFVNLLLCPDFGSLLECLTLGKYEQGWKDKNELNPNNVA